MSRMYSAIEDGIGEDDTLGKGRREGVILGGDFFFEFTAQRFEKASYSDHDTLRVQ